MSLIIKHKIPVPYRRILYTVLALGWLSGIGFFIFNNYMTIEGDFGSEKHPWQFPLLKIHGATAFFMMICYGALLTSHLPAGWKRGRGKKLGISLISLVAIQILSAYSLYYMTDEVVRGYMVYLHLVSGVLLPIVLTTHVINGRKYSASKALKLKSRVNNNALNRV